MTLLVISSYSSHTQSPADVACEKIRVILRDGVGSSGGRLAAGSAVPDTNGLALDRVLSAELADVTGVLCDLSWT